jgi:arsenate reductase-like glutaredoxin family protein
VPVIFVDLAQRPIAPTELRRFGMQFGAASLLDRKSRAYRDAGLAYLRLDDDECFERALSNQALLQLPLVRAGQRLSIGLDEAAWRAWLADGATA